MASMESNARWHEMAALRDEIERAGGRGPDLRPQARWPPARALAEGLRFAEALSFTDGWSRISDARSRRAA